MTNTFKKSLLFIFTCLITNSVMADLIFQFTVSSSTTAAGSYEAVNGSAECLKGMATGGSNEITIGNQTFYKFNSSTAWNFTLSGNHTFAVGDVITLTCACTTSNKTGKGVKVNGIVVTGDFPASTAVDISYTVVAGDAIAGKSTIKLERNDSDIKFGTIIVTRNGSGGGDDPTPGGGDDPTPGGGDDPTPGGGDDPTPGGGDTPTPSAALTTHTPEIYEDPAGYNTPLVDFNNSKYEVYYINRDNNDLSVSITNVDRTGNITNSPSAQQAKAKDGWFTISASSSGNVDSGKGKAKDEFKDGFRRFNMQSKDTMRMHIKGFTQLAIYAKDNSKKTGSNEKHFVVFIDGVQQTMSYAEDFTIRRFDFSSDEHDIIITAVGTSANQLTAFSLRVSDDPLVRHVKGGKDQTVYQTKNIEPVAFVVRRAASHRLTWLNDTQIPGVSLSEGTNDSVFVQGLANAATGTYRYKIEALDAENKVASEEQGAITIQTHVFDSKYGNNFTTNIAEPIKPLNFIFYASDNSDIELVCDIEGLNLQYANDSTAVLSGTPNINTTEGEHNYSITAKDGNSVSGKIMITIPNPSFEPISDEKVRDQSEVSFAIIAHYAKEITITGLPNGLTSNYNPTNGSASISGTINAGAPYPKVFEFTATATPLYDGKEQKSITGKMIVIDPNAKAILAVCKKIENVDEIAITSYLKNSQNYDMTLRQQSSLAGSSYDAFNLIIITEDVDADDKEVLNILREGVGKPILNLKGFTYAPERLGWGEPDNGTVDTISHNGQNIFIQRNDHPIFEGKNQNEVIKVVNLQKGKSLMPININNYDGSICLATTYTRDLQDYYSDGTMQTIIHEIPASLRPDKQKYICFPMSQSCTFTTEGKQLIDKIINYLQNNEQTVSVPELKITSFSIDGVAAQIGNDTILLEIDTTAHSVDLSKAIPAITVASQYTHTEPMVGEEVNFMNSAWVPVVYTVTDYINRRTYDVIVRAYNPQGIDEVYTAGEWVNIYDVFGRMITTTNQDIYTIDLPRGMYIVVTAKGETIKIMR